jgi:hypothetical protein
MTISGRLSGGQVGERSVSVFAWPYGRSAPTRIATLRTSPNGLFGFQAFPRIRTSYWVTDGKLTTPKQVVGVSPVLSASVLPGGHVLGHVTAAHSFYGRTMQLQLRNANGSWTTVQRRPVGLHSTAIFTKSIPAGTIRLAMSVNQTGAGYLGAATHALRYRPLFLTMKPVSFKVLFGHPVTLTGRLVNGGAGRHVAIVAQAYGRTSGARIATVTTKRGGVFSLKVKPAIMTTYQARLGAINPSTPMTVGVRPAMSVIELGNGSLRAHVTAAKTFHGRMVKLQKLVGSSWHTVAKKPLSRSSTATFAVSLPRSVVRVAMSVNQAGAGYLGTFSHPLVYRAI